MTPSMSSAACLTWEMRGMTANPSATISSSGSMPVEAGQTPAALPRKHFSCWAFTFGCHIICLEERVTNLKNGQERCIIHYCSSPRLLLSVTWNQQIQGLPHYQVSLICTGSHQSGDKWAFITNEPSLSISFSAHKWLTWNKSGLHVGQPNCWPALPAPLG